MFRFQILAIIAALLDFYCDALFCCAELSRVSSRARHRGRDAQFCCAELSRVSSRARHRGRDAQFCCAELSRVSSRSRHRGRAYTYRLRGCKGVVEGRVAEMFSVPLSKHQLISTTNLGHPFVNHPTPNSGAGSPCPPRPYDTVTATGCHCPCACPCACP
jgi:hypothetical protein